MINTTQVSATSEVDLKPNQAKGVLTGWRRKTLVYEDYCPGQIRARMNVCESIRQRRNMSSILHKKRNYADNTVNLFKFLVVQIKLPGAPGSREKCPPAYKRTTLLDNFLP
ncbi:hypothetical protein X801_01203 [Opisthorchis viverrini]|uniref:Uncharacterized protein n=1 Tax=Opisthorchis viverrini TaxID=6198 RepID=A0A1S8X840_OPIVI|nr:hypothetical protein X801_01203 [Opisthorchis viverrini]